MLYFPQLGPSFSLTQYPYSVGLSHRTIHAETPDGWYYSYAARRRPAHRFVLEFSSLSVEDGAKLADFHRQCEGRLHQFTFLDPNGNLIPQSEQWTHAAWQRDSMLVTPGQQDPSGSHRAATISGAGRLRTAILPDGEVSDLMVSASVLVKSEAATDVTLGFQDDQGNPLSQRDWRLPAGRWLRIRHRAQLTSAGPVSFVIERTGADAVRGLDVFAAQCVAGPSANNYAPSPLFYGLHQRCRFADDHLRLEYVEARRVRTRIAIEERPL